MTKQNDSAPDDRIIKMLRSDVFEVLRRHGVSEQCFAEVAIVTQGYIGTAREPVEPVADGAVIWVSPGQLERYLMTSNPSIPPQDYPNYLPVRLEKEGNFILPLYTHPAPERTRALEELIQGDADLIAPSKHTDAGLLIATAKDREAAEQWDLHWYGDLDASQIAALAQAFARHAAQARREALEGLESEARRFAEFYPEGSDGRNTFVIFADKIAIRAKIGEQ